MVLTFSRLVNNHYEHEHDEDLDEHDEDVDEEGDEVPKTKNRLMVTIHSKDVTEILALYRRSEIDFPPHFLVRLMHSFPMMYNTI